MNIAFVALRDMLCEWMVQGLEELRDHEVDAIWLNALPNVNAALTAAISDHVPHLVVYAGPAGGPHAPTPATLKHINDFHAPIVFLCFDASDVGWHGLLATYREHNCFNLIVNCDGVSEWPHKGRDLTLWCPVGHRAYDEHPRAFQDRIINFGFCGGHRSDPRYSIVSHLVRHAGLTVRAREDTYGTYQGYANFLMETRIALNIAYSAGGPHGQDPMTKQLKARVIEAGYAGCALLETRGSAAAQWFTPGSDFLTYETPQEAVFIVSNASPAYLAECAYNLHKKVMSAFTPKHFWDRVFEALR